jgi:hypothetical protein
VRVQFDGDATAQQLLGRLAENPHDVTVERELERVLQLQMRADTKFKEDVERMVDQPKNPAEESKITQIIADNINKSLVFNERVEINEGGFNVT